MKAGGRATDRQRPLLPHASSFGNIFVLDLEPQNLSKPQAKQIIDEGQVSARIYSVENAALLTSYFCAGFTVQLLYTPVTFYLIDTLGAGSSVYLIYSSLISMASNFKVFYGILSDCVPIVGYRRKPYLVMGWMTHTACYSLLAMMMEPGVRAVILLSFVAAAGHMLGDIMTDAIVIGRTKAETGKGRGALQASGYIAGAFGKVVGAIGGAILSNRSTWGWGLEISSFFWIAAAAPLVSVLPFVPHLVEVASPGHTPAEAWRENCHEIWQLVSNRAVYGPMTFIFLYYLFAIPNASWNNFLLEGLDFSTFEVGLITIGGATAYWLGLVIYKSYLRDIDWQALWVYTTFANFMMTLSSIMLVVGWNHLIGIPDVVFAVLQSVGIYGCTSMIVLPACVMFALMCPIGSEGTSYAMLTTMATAAAALATAIGDLMAGIWDVSDAAIESGDYNGVWKLSLVTAFVGVIPIVLLFLMPRSKEEQQLMQQGGTTSARAGAIFLVVAAGSIAFSLGEYIWKIIEE